MPMTGKSGMLKPGGVNPGGAVGKIGDDLGDMFGKTGTTMMEGTSGVNPGGAVGKVVGDDIVNPTKKVGKAMMGGQITK